MNKPLDADNLHIELSSGGPILLPKALTYLQNAGYQVDELLEAHTVARSESERAHLILKIRTFDKTRDDPGLDVSVDSIETFVCDCWSYHNSMPDLRDFAYTPEDLPRCVHIRAVDKVSKAESDPNQGTLL